jgi:hypothetical protein
MRALGLLVLGALAGGCWWTDKEAVEQAVWSDDGARYAWVDHAWQEESGMFVQLGRPAVRDSRHRIYLRAVSGGAATDLTGERADTQFLTLYDMRSAGYVLATALDVDGRRVLQFAGGAETKVAEIPYSPAACQVFDGIPSPDGGLLALLHRSEPDQPQVDTTGGQPVAVSICNPGTVKVTFLDAKSRAVLAGPFSWASGDQLDGTWTPAGEFLVAERQTRRAWRVDRAAGPQVVAYPGCVAPATTSSSVSGAGVEIGPNTPADPVRTVRTGAPAFGCQ